MTEEICVRLDNYHNYYSPGDTIIGRVECNFLTEKNIRAVTVKLKGVCCTSWTEFEKYYDDFFKEERRKDITYRGQEVYFYEQLDLLGFGPVKFPAGQYYYPFSYTLPQNLPTTYSGRFFDARASVSYTIKAKTECVTKNHLKTKREIAVMSPLDLNSISDIKKPVEVSMDKVLCSCWCNGNDSITFTFTLPGTGYVAGEDVPIGAYVENMTNINVKEIRFNISQITEFIVTAPSARMKRNKEVLVDRCEAGVGAHGEKSWTSVLSLPANNPCHNMVKCSLVNVTYRLKAELFLPCPHTNLVTSFPIIIGHIPFRNSARGNFLLGPADVRSLNSLPDFLPRRFSEIPLEEQAPPSYEEAEALMRQSLL